MKRFQFWTVLNLVLLFANDSQARASYKGVVQMIESAEVIAVVEITSVEKVWVKGKHWTYWQKASAKVEKVVKGKVSGSVFLYGDEEFVCARCHFEPGRYLVFLDRDDALLTGNNWHLSTRKITGDSKEKVAWFEDQNLLRDKEVLLSDVLREIAALLDKHKSSKP